MNEWISIVCFSAIELYLYSLVFHPSRIRRWRTDKFPRSICNSSDIRSRRFFRNSVPICHSRISPRLALDVCKWQRSPAHHQLTDAQVADTMDEAIRDDKVVTFSTAIVHPLLSIKHLLPHERKNNWRGSTINQYRCGRVGRGIQVLVFPLSNFCSRMDGVTDRRTDGHSLF